MKPDPTRWEAWLPPAALGAVLVTLAWGASHGPTREPRDPDRDVSLMAPDPRVSPSKSILLQNQYRYFLRFRADDPRSTARQDAARKYNLFTTECSPDVFQKTHLPHSVR